MRIEITRRRTRRFGFRMGALIIATFAIMGLLRRDEALDGGQEINFTQVEAISANSLMPMICLEISPDASKRERGWINALAEYMGGSSEVRFEGGRADIITERYAIEVDFIAKWKEGLGQALVYGAHFDKVPGLAIIAGSTSDLADNINTINLIDSMTAKQGVKAFLLVLQASDCNHKMSSNALKIPLWKGQKNQAGIGLMSTIKKPLASPASGLFSIIIQGRSP